MTKRPPACPEQPGHGTPEMLREIIAEALRSAALHADHGSEYALIGDVRLLRLNFSHTVAYLKVAIDTLSDLMERDAKRAPH